MFELRILKSLLNTKDFVAGNKINKILDYVFEDQAYKDMFNIIFNYNVKYGETPTPEFLENFFKIEKESNARAIYNEIKLIEISEDSNLNSLIDLQVNHTIRMRVINTVSKYDSKIKTISASELKKTINDLIHEISTVVKDTDSDLRKEIVLYGEQAKTEIRSDYNSSASYLCDFGIKSLDQTLGGIYLDDYINIAGYSGQGKSTLLRQIAYNIMLQGFNVVYITLEMKAVTNSNHFITLHANNQKIFGYDTPKISAFKIRNKTLSKQEEEYYFDVVAEDLFNNPNYGSIKIIEPSSSYNITSLFNDVTHVHRTLFPVNVVVVDYLAPLVRPNTKKSPEREDYNDMITEFRRFMLSNNMVGINACQINRDGFNRAVKDKANMYDLSVMSDYNRLERDATVVLSVIQTPFMLKSKEVQIQNLKARESAICQPFRMVRDGETGWHYEMSAVPTNEDAVNILKSIQI